MADMSDVKNDAAVPAMAPGAPGQAVPCAALLGDSKQGSWNSSATFEPKKAKNLS